MKKEVKNWHLLSPEDYNKVFDSLSKKKPKHGLNIKIGNKNE